MTHRTLWDVSPAYPAVLLLHGLTFGIALLHFLGFSWPHGLAAYLYVALTLWVLALSWQRRDRLVAIGLLDGLFLVFLVLVLASLAWGGAAPAVAGRFAVYLALMVVTPYLCGRLMGELDVWRLGRTLLLAGLVVVPLCLLDYLLVPGHEGARWPFFGQDHGALLVGALLAAALLMALADPFGLGRGDRAPAIRWFALGLPAALALALVWVAARGWLLAAVVGVVVMLFAARNDRALRWRYLRALGLVLLVIVLALRWLPVAKGDFYAGLLSVPPAVSGLADSRIATAPTSAQGLLTSGPVLGAQSCRPFEEARSSVAIRQALYLEAFWMFRLAPMLGVGVGRFGDHSCSGAGGFPHSSVLQAFSELGVVGGGLLVAMLLVGVATLLRHVPAAQANRHSTVGILGLGLLLCFLFADQIYGNYLMSTGVYLLLGIAARMRADAGPGQGAR